MSNNPSTSVHEDIFLNIPFDLNVLQRLENDLDLREIISLTFLLYDDIPVAQERLMLSVRAFVETNSTHNLGLLSSWAVANPNIWKRELIEGLLVIKAYSNVKKLKLNLDSMKCHFLPEQPLTTLFIHPLKKALFIVCESLVRSDVENIIPLIQRDSRLNDTSSSDLNSINTFDFKYFELFLLKLLRSGFIKIGFWNYKKNYARNESSDMADLHRFVDILKELKFYELADILESCEKYVNEMMTNSVKNTTTPESNYCTMQPINDNSIPIAPESLRKMNNNNESFPVDSIYPVYNLNNMGLIMIINNMKFENKAHPELTKDLLEREGSEVDERRLIQSWGSFGFKPHACHNLSCEEIMLRLKYVLTEIIEDEHSAFILCILSHGKKGVIMSKDGVPLEIDKIKEMFNTSKAPHLAGKPKILIIQSCQGEDKLPTIIPSTVSSIKHDGPQSIPELSDLFEFQSTVPNYVSYRHEQEGSWFIKSLCDHLDKIKTDSQCFLKICLSVNREISLKRDGNYGQMSQFTTTFTKELYLKKLQSNTF